MENSLIENLNIKTENHETFDFEVLEEPVVLVSIPKDKYLSYMHFITKLFFYSVEPNFISLTKNVDEISLIASKSLIRENLTSCYIYEQEYYVFKIIEYSDALLKIGIVNNLSKIMCDNRISILYITTYNNDYILVEKNQLDKAKKCLIANGFNMC